jgi:MoxR-like ATPase
LSDAAPLATVDDVTALLSRGRYVAGKDLSTAIFLALHLQRPLLLEGEAGVGKTEVAKVLASQLGRRLIRLQCYEGLDLSSAVYEWNYPRQMLEIRLAEAKGREPDVYDDSFLVKRPLLAALEPHLEGPPVLLIDELDRTDEPFEAFLLELLSDFQITIPETGTVRAASPPIVLLTSNRTREIHDALKRRCLYHWVDYPDLERELAIVMARFPDVDARLARSVVSFVQKLRAKDLFKLPGVAESLDWTQAVLALQQKRLSPEVIDATLGVVLKVQDDIERVRREGVEALMGDP